jgi:nitroreductase
MKMRQAKFEPLEFREETEEAMVAASRAFYQAMKTRRTVRDFSPRPIPEEVIENAIRTAGTAPSGANLQPWHFTVVTNPEIKRRIRRAAEEEERAFYQERAPTEWLEALKTLGTDENKPFLETAPYLIVVFSKKFVLDEDGDQRKTYYATESVGIAVGMLIAALHLSGLATLTHTPSPMGFLNEILGRPESERPFLIVITGYPAGNAIVPQISKLDLEQIATFV